MRKQLIALIFAGLIFSGSLWSQCPDRNVLWSKLINLKSSKLTPADQLAELMAIEKRMNNCPYRNDSTHIFLLRKIGDFYFQQHDYIKAVQYRQQAIDIINNNANKPSVKLNTLPGNYYWLSVAYDSLNNFTEKMRALDSCASIAIRLKIIDRASLYALYTRVEYYFDIGDYHRCIDYAEKCEMLGREYADKNRGIEKEAGEGYASSSLGWHVNALIKLEQFEKAENILQDKVNEYKKAGRINYLGVVYAQLADVQEQKGNIKATLSYYNQALSCFETERDYFNCKQTTKDIGYNVYSKHYKDADKALLYYKKALGYINNDKFRSIEDRFESLNIYSNIGAVYVRQGSYDSAFRYFQMAFDQFKPGSNEEDISNITAGQVMQVNRSYYLTGLLINKGDAYRKLYENKDQRDAIQKAIHIYKITDQLLDRIKSVQTDLQSKLFWRRDSRRLYELAIDACYLQGNPAGGFYFFEKSRAVLLNDQLNEQRWMGENDILKLTQLKKKILRLERELNAVALAADQSAAIKTEIFAAKQELDRLEQLIKAGNPLYFQSFLDTSSITMQYVQQKLLKEHDALLEIFSGDSAVYALLITRQNSYLTKINKQDYEKTATKYILYLSNPDLINRKFDDFVSVSNHLYKLVFQNLSLQGSRIIISPDGQCFPFESLITNIFNHQPAYFIFDHAVSYTYSARFLMNDFKSGSVSGGKNFMGIAPVNYPSTFSLTALPGSDVSLIKIASYFDNAVNKVTTHASRNNFLQQFSKYRIIQLYTHASDSSGNNEPVIYFSDSALYLSDLINAYKPMTRLIVLSACETGAGKNYQGEGVFSFNRGFAALGIPAAISNLWTVENESTYQLTELFYKHLAQGLPTDIALQKGKLEFMQNASKEKLLPYYWAGQVLVGKTDIIELRKHSIWYWIIFSLIMGAVIFFGYKKVYNKT